MKSVYLVLHNIRSAFNVGSILRTADAAGIARVYLCGYTPIPARRGRKMGNDKIAKTSLGAEKAVVWEYHSQTWRLLDQLRKEGIHTISLEQSAQSMDYREYKPVFPLALVVGNEVRGLNKEILQRCDKVIELPMRGKKESLNVSVATGIAIYKLLE